MYKKMLIIALYSLLHYSSHTCLTIEQQELLNKEKRETLTKIHEQDRTQKDLKIGRVLAMKMYILDKIPKVITGYKWHNKARKCKGKEKQPQQKYMEKKFLQFENECLDLMVITPANCSELTQYYKDIFSLVQHTDKKENTSSDITN